MKDKTICKQMQCKYKTFLYQMNIYYLIYCFNAIICLLVSSFTTHSSLNATQCKLKRQGLKGKRIECNSNKQNEITSLFIFESSCLFILVWLLAKCLSKPSAPCLHPSSLPKYIAMHTQRNEWSVSINFIVNMHKVH